MGRGGENKNRNFFVLRKSGDFTMNKKKEIGEVNSSAVAGAKKKKSLNHLLVVNGAKIMKGCDVGLEER